jgi:molybdopterin molybdotransferase
MTRDIGSSAKVKTPDEVLALLASFSPLSAETIPLDRVFGRVLAEDLIAPEDVPGFDRATRDGFAVRTAETNGAGPDSSVRLEIVGEVRMGAEAGGRLGPGQAVRIWTGGMLPSGADAVVMLEDSRQINESTMELTRAVASGQHVISRGDDVRAGSRLLPRGQRLRPQHVGLLAAMGLTQVPVHRRPRVAILSTGDEVVPVAGTPGPGQVRDVNAHVLAAQAARCQAEPISLGLVGDDRAALGRAVAQGLEEADVVLISGGTSVGRRDFTLKTLLSLPGAELLVHGVAISPGKQTILVRSGQKTLWGLPGPISGAMVVFDLFVRPLLARLSGEMVGAKGTGPTVMARLGGDLAPAAGRERFFQVRLERTGDGLMAWPIQRTAGPLSGLIQADGLIRVPAGDKGLRRDQEVEVLVFD